MDERLAVIDGNRNFHPVMRGILRSLGYRRIEPFLQGEEALDHLRSTWCDLAFVELALVDGNGLALINRLRRADISNRRMPIIVLTSHTSRRTVSEAMAAGADYVMAKPVSPKLLADRVRYLNERPLDYIALGDGYFGPDPTRYQPRRRTGRSEPLVRTIAPTEPFPSVTPFALDEIADSVPAPAPRLPYGAVRSPEIIFLD